MSIDGRLLSRAKTRLDAQRAEREERLNRRREEIYTKLPRVGEIDAALRATMFTTIGIALSKHTDTESAIDAVRRENLSLQDERRQILLRAGYPEDYLSDEPVCPRCRDTGYDGTRICDCLMALYRQEQQTELSEFLKMGEDTFENFDLTYYDDTADPATGLSERNLMAMIYQGCKSFVARFGSGSAINILMTGGPGLGKTFLSTCIARAVLDKGYSVVYDTASSVFSKYEEVRFGRGDDAASARSDVRRLENCDLLILDDLGTELVTSYVVSALYTLINTRLTAKKQTIISTNLSVDDIGERYSAPILSRIRGDYEEMRFVGTDIRELKKARRAQIR